MYYKWYIGLRKMSSGGLTASGKKALCRMVVPQWILLCNLPDSILCWYLGQHLGTNLNLSISVSYCKLCQLYLLYKRTNKSTSGLSSLIEADTLQPTSAELAYLLQSEVRVWLTVLPHPESPSRELNRWPHTAARIASIPPQLSSTCPQLWSSNSFSLLIQTQK